MGKRVSPHQGFRFQMQCTDSNWFGAAAKWPVTMSTGPDGSIVFESERNWFDYDARHKYMCTFEHFFPFHFECGEIAKPMRIELMCTRPTMGSPFITRREKLHLMLFPGGEQLLQTDPGVDISPWTLRDRYCFIGKAVVGQLIKPEADDSECVEKEA
ncbi:hypothetical protein CDD82_6470 [Ophiocordyceps australis]|uniref:Uncharacterized protein n=1 Tax=Ophiocordyceps australis TaxID=1399860 RepID=A0A2C5ZR31_9HYPO|nr:hypothetical protein CDD82_6470 [Ophiocordyceps australis]